jgi:LmbE family N-acetylglucosaminyl deacetylase
MWWKLKMVDPAKYQAYVQQIEDLFYHQARKEGHSPAPAPILVEESFSQPLKTILLCSPHPDDEALTGALPLRLQQETGARVVNIAITLGSNEKRRSERLAELEESCSILGFENVLVTEPLAHRQVTGLTRGQTPSSWREMVAGLCDLLKSYGPDLVLYPHGDDCHPTHVGSHALVFEALKKYSLQEGGQVLTLESECWQPMADPNLLVGLSGQDVARLMAALSAHRGEVARNPYHLRLPARFMENVCRVGERISGFGGSPPGFAFAEVYRLGMIRDGFQQFALSSTHLPQTPMTWQGFVDKFE